MFAAWALNRPVPEIEAMHPRDLATLLEFYDEVLYASGETERKRRRLEAHGIDPGVGA